MKTKIHKTTVTYTRNGVTRVLRHRTEEQAQLAAQAIDRCQKDREMTVAQFYALWQQMHADARLSRNSRSSYRATFAVHVLPRLGHIPLASLDTSAVLSFIDALASEAGCYRKITPTVLRLQAMMNKAVDWGLIDENPVMRVDALFLGGKPTGLGHTA